MMTPNDKEKELKIRRAKTGDAARLADLSGQLGYPTTAAQMRERLRGIKPAFQPRFSALGMARTQGQLGIGPQSLAAVISDLLIRA